MARTARYTASVSAMVEDDMKAFLLGSAEVEGVSEGDVIRALFEDAIERAELTEQQRADRMARGREQLAARRGG